MTHSPFNKSCHPDRQAEGRTGAEHDGPRDRQKTKDTACEYFNPPLRPRTRLPAPNGRKREKAVGVIGPRRWRSGVNGLILGLTPFKTNLRLCVIVLLTKFLTRSVFRFIVLLKETCCPAKGHLMVFQTRRITLMYCRSKDKTRALAHALGKNEVPRKRKGKKNEKSF